MNKAHDTLARIAQIFAGLKPRKGGAVTFPSCRLLKIMRILINEGYITQDKTGRFQLPPDHDEEER